MLREDLSKLVFVIDNLNVDSSTLKAKIAELMAASTEYSSLRVTSLEKLNPDVRAQQLVTIDSSLAQVQSSQQAVLGVYQTVETSLASVRTRLDALVQERERLEAESSHLERVFADHQEEISQLEQEKGMAMESPTLSPTEVESLKDLEDLLEDRLHSFRGITFE